MLKATSLLLLLLILTGSITYAQQGRDMAKEKAIWAELESPAPQSVADFKAATEAMDAQNYEKAIDLRALQNLYELRLEQTSNLQQQIQGALNRMTSEDDTHPSPNDRFRLTRKITGTDNLPATGMVWDWFKNREALTDEMTLLIQSEVQSV